MEFKLDTKLGYMYAYSPRHYLANGAGKVYEHVYVMCRAIGRSLTKDECVHHKNRNRADNSLPNLQLMSHADHVKLHHMEDRGVVYIHIKCPACGTEFETTENAKRTYCSVKCASANRAKFDISKEDLELLVWSTPTTHVAEMLGVSDVAVAKRCKKLGISKPPRGYWAKQLK